MNSIRSESAKKGHMNRLGEIGLGEFIKDNWKPSKELQKISKNSSSELINKRLIIEYFFREDIEIDYEDLEDIEFRNRLIEEYL